MQHLLMEAAHVALGARMMDFHGYYMPIQYSSIKEEHLAVRTGVGFFDCSHMGEFFIEGEDAAQLVNYAVTNDIATLAPNKVRYAHLCNREGGVIDDILVHKFDDEKFMLVVNASNIDKDFDWLTAQCGDFNAHITDMSEEFCLYALQGPDSEKAMSRFVSDLSVLEYYSFIEGVIAGAPCLIARTGYTGERGYEVYTLLDTAELIWNALWEAGAACGMKPCGLGARDTLRLEAAMPLYGNELDEQTTPFDAGLGWVVKLAKADFLGKAALEQAKQRGASKKLAGFELHDKRIARTGAAILKDGKPVGAVTSGSMGFACNKSIGLGYVAPACAATGTTIEVDIRGTAVPATIVQTPFIQNRCK